MLNSIRNFLAIIGAAVIVLMLVSPYIKKADASQMPIYSNTNPVNIATQMIYAQAARAADESSSEAAAPISVSSPGYDERIKTGKIKAYALPIDGVSGQMIVFDLGSVTCFSYSRYKGFSCVKIN
jgi:hypothetical protein